MILVQGEKYACLNCIRGHRSSTCDHTNRPLVQVRRRGRPNHACQHRLAVIAEPTCSCGMTAVLVPEHSAASVVVKDEDKKPGSLAAAAAKKSSKSVGIIRIGAHSKKIIDTSNGKVTVLDTPVNQFLKENPSGNCTCAASGLEPKEYFQRLKQKSCCGSKEEKVQVSGCCVKVEGDVGADIGAGLAAGGHGHGHMGSAAVPGTMHIPLSQEHPDHTPHGHSNGHPNGHPTGHPNGHNSSPLNPIQQVPQVQHGQTQHNGQYQAAPNSYYNYQQPYLYNSSYYPAQAVGHTVQVQTSHVPLPQQIPLDTVQDMAKPSLPASQVQTPIQSSTPLPPSTSQSSAIHTPTQTITSETLFGQIDPSFAQMWKGESPRSQADLAATADSTVAEDRLTPEEFFDMYFAPTCSIPGQCGCGEGCQCKGCPTHDNQTEQEGGATSEERFTWE